MDISGWSAMAEKFGLDSIDLSVLITRCDRSIPAFPVDTVATYTDFTHPDKTVRECEFNSFMDDVRDCARIGARYLRVTAGQAHPETSTCSGLDWAAGYLGKAADFAKSENVGLLFENHSKPGVWKYYDFAGEPEIYFELVKRLEGVNIDLLFDTANACFYRQDPVLMLEKIFPRVRRIHVADIAESDDLKPVLIGHGIVPLSEIFGYLGRNGFIGSLSIEEASFCGADGVEKAVRATRCLWRDACFGA
jgi:sugar phosphate isomerase/epimerase